MPGSHLSTRRSASPSPAQSHEAISYAHDDSQDLSKRELQIVELIAAGLTNQEISLELEISKRTVDNHVSNILNKTTTGNRVALVRWALQSGKVCLDELNCCHLPR
jgi:DNA-binding NarL/FixJ family response regulator